MGDNALDRGVNSCRPLDRLQYVFALCDLMTLTFDLLIYKPYPKVIPCTKFEDKDHSFLSCRGKTHRFAQTRGQTRMNALLPRLSSA